jgi:hypothetical protein
MLMVGLGNNIWNIPTVRGAMAATAMLHVLLSLEPQRLEHEWQLWLSADGESNSCCRVRGLVMLMGLGNS